MFVRTVILSHIIALLVISPVYSQGLQTATPEEVGLSSERLGRIDKVMQQHVEENKIAGAVTMVARHGKVAHFETFGMMDIENNKPMQHDTIFRIASMTKPITSVAVMILYEEGHFLLSDPISKYIHEFKGPMVLIPDKESSEGAYTLEPAKSPITIRHLLNHTSGIIYGFYPINPEEPSRMYWESGVSKFRLGISLKEFVKELAMLPLAHHPGEAFEYGFNTDVLGYLVEVISGMPFDKFLEKRLFKPLGMIDTHFYLPKEKTDRLAAVYKSRQDAPLIRYGDEPIQVGPYIELSVSMPYAVPKHFPAGGSGLCSTVSDYFRFTRMILNGGELDAVRILSPQTVEIMISNSIGDLFIHDYVRSFAGDTFGLGFGIRSERTFSELESQGTFNWAGAYGTFFWIDPTEDMIGLFMSQLLPNDSHRIDRHFQVLAYQAIID